MSSFKRINPSDQFQDIIVVNKQWTGTYSSYPYSDDYIKVYTGMNSPTFDVNGPQDQNVYYKLEYDKINQMFYQDYTSSLDTQQRTAYSTNYDSASAYRATNSYFVYNENPLFTTQFPTGSGNTIKTVYINKSVYGNRILPGTLILSSSDYYILDDGNGNLYDFKFSNTGLSASYFSSGYVDYNYVIEYDIPVGGKIFVGNIFYSFGLCVVTNQSYQNYFPVNYSGATPPTWNSLSSSFWSNINNSWSNPYIANVTGSPVQISFQNEYPIYENFIYCKTKAGEFNLTYNPSLYSNNILPDFTTGSLASGSYFTPYATTIGLYNDNNDLLMVAKLGQPIPISSNNDMTFVIRYDT